MAIVATAAVGIAFESPTIAQRFESPNLASRLESRVSVVWQGQTLGNALARLNEAFQLDVWLDRRVDNRLEVELTARNQTGREVVSALADQHGLAVVSLDELAYVGPSDTAGDLRTLAAIARQTVSRMPPALKQRWLRKSSIRWRRLNEPRRLAVDLVESAGAELINPDAIPHDLWPERESASMPRVDQLVLLLFGFDLTCEFSPDGRQIRIAPIVRPIHLTNDYQASPRQINVVQSFLHQWPDAVMERKRGGVRLHAGWEEHQHVRRFLGLDLQQPERQVAGRSQPQRSGARNGGRRVFTLQLDDQPLGAVLDQLSAQLGITVEWSAELDQTALRQRRVSCSVRNANSNHLLQAVLEAATLTYRRTDKGILVVAPASSASASRD